MHAVGRGARNEIHPGFGLEDPQRHIEGEGVAGAASVAVRGDHRHLGKGGERGAQPVDTLGTVTIVVTDQDLHVRFLGA